MITQQDFMRHRERMRSWLLGKEYFKAVEALEFASKYHAGVRKDGVTPEFHHQISIAHYLRTLSNLRDQEAVLITAFLHDLIEDHNVSTEVISSKFGENVKNAVLLMSKKVQDEKKILSDYYMKMESDHIASVVKGGDRVHNFQTMHSIFTCEKQMRYINECEKYILPMLKEARNKFPDQELAYENIKHALKGQIELLKLSIEAKAKVIEWEESSCEDT